MKKSLLVETEEMLRLSAGLSKNQLLYGGGWPGREEKRSFVA